MDTTSSIDGDGDTDAGVQIVSLEQAPHCSGYMYVLARHAEQLAADRANFLSAQPEFNFEFPKLPPVRSWYRRTICRGNLMRLTATKPAVWKPTLRG